MIREKTIELSDKAKNYLEANNIYTSKEVCYGYSQKLIDLVVEECISAVENTDLRDITYTTFDKDRVAYCRSQIMKNVKKVMEHGNSR